MKMTFRTKIKKKLYHVNQHQKYYKLFPTMTFFLTALLIAVRLNFSNAPRDQDNLLKLHSALSAIALQNLCTFLGRVPALGAAMAESRLSNFDRLS